MCNGSKDREVCLEIVKTGQSLETKSTWSSGSPASGSGSRVEGSGNATPMEDQVHRGAQSAVEEQ